MKKGEAIALVPMTQSARKGKNKIYNKIHEKIFFKKLKNLDRTNFINKIQINSIKVNCGGNHHVQIQTI